MNSITVIIPTYNEEAYIKEAIQSVKFASQIIVIDSNSTDNTAEIAKQMGCEIHFRDFDNFSNQKNHALQFAKNDWILFLDADVFPKSKQFIYN
ncbi:glycosyltransferase, partial [Aurantibacter sp.]|uniref:glycosyltransferase n=1 Tax=Aurantibacter sp. TaxID=2807103 RepID=UPI0035C79B34